MRICVISFTSLSQLFMEYNALKKYCQDQSVELVAVSKTRSVAEIMELYDQGQRHFGENRVQEWLEKKDQLPKDIHWHLIGIQNLA